ncbi:fumarate hydratase [Antarctobacter sp.]|uniref:fumarate hydratase n=1 Tax=Antarctobacter sp. TaxID=1872577 RepID=UPI003A8E09A8
MTRPQITEAHVVDSIHDALQYISTYHPPDFIRGMARAWDLELSAPAKAAIGQILMNSRMAAFGRRPICQDTGVANVHVRLGVEARTAWRRSLQDLVDEGTRRAYLSETNPLRASIVVDPLFGRRNTGDNTPAMLTVELVPGDQMEITVSAKGGGSENKTKFAVLNPSDSVSDWVVSTVETLGAGWCPPGILGLGVGGSVDKAMALAKQALNEPIDATELRLRGPSTPVEEMRLDLIDRINATGLGAQGLGGVTTVLDVKIATFPTHAASLPVALVPNCAATRHVKFTLDGHGPAQLEPPAPDLWPDIDTADATVGARRVALDTLTREEIARWRIGETVLLSGRLLTARDAAHRRLQQMLARGQEVPVSFRDRAVYYVGPVDPVGAEVVGPAGPTTSGRMDRYSEMMLGDLGAALLIGKAERNAETEALLARHRAVYLIAVGGAAYLVSKAITAARVVAFDDLGMEAIHEFEVRDMPVTVAVDAAGNSLHRSGPFQWRRPA